MGFRYCTDTTAADWLVHSEAPAGRLLTFGPDRFPAYARLRLIPDPTRPDQEEADVVLADGHPSDLAQVRRALHRLAAFTDTPQKCYFCLWDGYSDVPLPPPSVELPYRSYVLFRAPLDAVDGWETAFGDGTVSAPPAFVWPADRRWCLACDVDPHWAGIGADRAAVTALVADPLLDVVPARPTQPQPRYR